MRKSEILLDSSPLISGFCGSEEDVATSSSDPQNPEIKGEESSRISLFLIEEYDLSDDTTLNGGIRWDSIEREYQSTIADRDDTTFSASGGVSHDLNELWDVSGNVSYSELRVTYITTNIP